VVQDTQSRVRSRDAAQPPRQAPYLIEPSDVSRTRVMRYLHPPDGIYALIHRAGAETYGADPIGQTHDRAPSVAALLLAACSQSYCQPIDLTGLT